VVRGRARALAAEVGERLAQVCVVLAAAAGRRGGTAVGDCGWPAARSRTGRCSVRALCCGDERALLCVCWAARVAERGCEQVVALRALGAEVLGPLRRGPHRAPE
jgi:hypothetical protein